MVVNILFGLTVLLFFVSLWWVVFKNQFIVQPNKRERIVLQNVLLGTMEVLEPGVHFRPPWMSKLEDVDLNREPILVEGGEFKSSDGALMTAKYRLDLIAGRGFNRETGQLLNPNPDERSSLDEEAIKLAVTRIDFAQRTERVKELMAAAVAAELGLYKFRDLTSPTDGVDIASLDIAGVEICPRTTVSTIADFNAAIAERIEARCNQRLTHVGLNVTGVRIFTLKASAASQESVEKPLRSGYETSAAEKILQGAHGQSHQLTYREALVAEDPASFGAVARAEATRDAAQSISEAVRRGTAAISDGLRRFGKG